MEDEAIGLLRPFRKSNFDALAHCRRPHSGQRPFGIPNDIVCPRAAVTTVSPLSNTPATDCGAAYTASIASGTHPSRRRTKPGSNEDRTARADCWWEINERCHKETEEREGFHIIHNWKRRCSRCREWVGRRWNKWSYQYELREWYKCSADDRGRISTGKRWGNHRGDADLDVDNDSGGNTRASWCSGWRSRFNEKDRWAREEEDGEDGSGFEGRYRYDVVIWS
jgi:hypothetical protein